jgi:inner membrane protein
LRGHWNVERMAWFSSDFIALRERDGVARLADLRMGQEPVYFFTFEVARRNQQGGWGEVPAVRLDPPAGARRGLGWIWARMWDPTVPPIAASS